MRSATGALHSIDANATQDGQARLLAQTRATTPEMRLLQKHFDAMGADDQRRLKRLDPSQHLFGCRCALCDKAKRECPICGDQLTGALNLANHLERHRRSARKARGAEQAERRRRMSAGLGFVEALLGDPERAAALDLRSLREFEERIQAASGQKRRRTRMGAVRNALTSAQDDPNGQTILATNVPNSIACVVYRLALLSGTSPRAVMAALLSWGIERFAEDVRKMRAAAPPHVEQRMQTPEQPEKPGFFPSAEESIA